MSQPNKSEVRITVILAGNQSFQPLQTQRKCPQIRVLSINKCDIDEQPEIAIWPPNFDHGEPE